MRSVIIDCDGVASSAEFWQRYLEALQPVEPGFGRNLDALWDALAGGPGYPGNCELVFKNSDALKDMKTFGGTSLLDGLQQIAGRSVHIKVTVA